MDLTHLNLFTFLILTWLVMTVCLVGLVIYRGVVGINEETELFLDKAESHLAREQHDIVDRVERVSKPIRILIFACGALLLVIAGMWLWRGWNGV
jgi:hypothetical protein